MEWDGLEGFSNPNQAGILFRGSWNGSGWKSPLRSTNPTKDCTSWQGNPEEQREMEQQQIGINNEKKQRFGKKTQKTN